MNTLSKTVTGILLFAGIPCSDLSAQAFRKGSLLVSISEGYTNARYKTTNTDNNDVKQATSDGDRDPLTVEYGVSDHWGFGINLGGDVLHVNPSSFYGLETPGNRVKVITSEVTADAHYHFFVTKKTDLSAFTSLGISSVSFEGHNGDNAYKYDACGGIIRIGAQVRYYIFRRFGILGMVSGYSMSCSTKDVADNTIAKNYSTALTGYAIEFGLCYRILK